MIRLLVVTLRVQRVGRDKVLELFSERGRLWARAEGAAAPSRWSGKTEPFLLLDVWLHAADREWQRLVRADLRRSYWSLAADPQSRRWLAEVGRLLREPPPGYPLPQTYRGLRLLLEHARLTEAHCMLLRRCLEMERDRGSVPSAFLDALAEPDPHPSAWRSF